MTYKSDYTIPEDVLEQICEEGFDALADLIRIMLNTAMKIERERHLGAKPYERTPKRRGRANGFKPKTMATRVATLFPNEASCLRLVTAVVMEISEDWQTGKAYIKWESDRE